MPKLRVDLPDGPVVITPGGPGVVEPIRYTVSGGSMTVAADKLDDVLRLLPGTAVVDTTTDVDKASSSS